MEPPGSSCYHDRGLSTPPPEEVSITPSCHPLSDATPPSPPRAEDPPSDSPASAMGWARYALEARGLPRVEAGVGVAEKVRGVLMGIHRRLEGGDAARVSPLFSGKGPGGTPGTGHDHAFFLPLDEDGDGRIDHLLVRAPRSFNAPELEALDRLRSLWIPEEREEIRLVLLGIGGAHARRAVRWRSVTPFVTARHHRPGRGPFDAWLAEEIRRECAFHALPSPRGLSFFPATAHTTPPIPWWRFQRSRKDAPHTPGFGAEIVFPEPVEGPFALGALCHFGLGVFDVC